MKKAVSTIAAAMMLAAFLCLGMTDQGWACTDCICFTGATCSSNDDCDEYLTTDCTRTVFSPDCDGTYALYAAVTSCGDVCEKCYSCVNIFKLEGTTETLIANCHTHLCASDDCETDCGAVVSLNSNGTYVMYVCQINCPIYTEDCSQCNASCVAVGCLSFGPSTTPCTL